jgi:hypothetical protein
MEIYGAESEEVEVPSAQPKEANSDPAMTLSAEFEKE